MESIQSVRVPCRFCGKPTWLLPNHRKPVCCECYELATDADEDSYEVELTLHPLTEWSVHPEQD